MEYRFEQLAKTAGVAVDTLRFYLGQKLLEPPLTSGLFNSEHLARLRQIRDLQQRNFTPEIIRRFLEGSLTTSDQALVEAITLPSNSAAPTLTRTELAAMSGVSESFLSSLEAAGLLVPLSPTGEPHYSQEDLQALQAGLALLEAGLPLTALLELGSEHTTAIENTAKRAVELFDQHVRRRLQNEIRDQEETEKRLLELFDQLLEASSSLVRHHFRRSLLNAARARLEE